jgi:hypothetical protein
LVEELWLVDAWNDLKQTLPWLYASLEQCWQMNSQLMNGAASNLQMMAR